MQDKHPSDFNRLKKGDSNAFVSNAFVPCASLVSRLDTLAQPARSPSSTWIPTVQDPTAGLRLGSPLFTRMVQDGTMTQVARAHFLAELSGFGIGWVGRSAENSPHWERLLNGSIVDSPQRIASIELDEPIDAVALADASAIELQLYGVPFRSYSSSRRAKWTPSLPIEIFHFEQLSKKISALRMMSFGKAAIGAAVCPGAVYEDVRFLADSGCDYVCLLVDVQYELTRVGTRRLAPIESCLELAYKAVKDAGSKIKILLAANLLTADEMFRHLRSGVAAVCMDGYLASCRPEEPNLPKETFGSILNYASPPVSAFAWLKPSISDLVQELDDWDEYAG